MRFGLIGTGFWAREAHAEGILATEGASLGGVWGRDPAKADDVAAQTGCPAFRTVEELLDAVDAVTFAVPPDVQAGIAVEAARRGKHLLLEKPLALSTETAAAVADAVQEAGVASVVLFTDRFTAQARDWWADVADGDWEGGLAVWTVNAFQDGSPFATPWREEHGGLWDVGPHAVSNLVTALGPVTGMQACRGARDLVHLILQHASGATSSAIVTLTAPREAARVSLELWGPRGWTSLPTRSTPAWLAVRQAALDLMSAAARAAPGAPPKHPCDAAFGRENVELLAQAQRLLDAAASA
jgi:predicted dehydrogenase